MFNLGFEAFATFIIIVAPIAIMLFLIFVLIAYPWLLLVPLGIWYLSIKYGPDADHATRAPVKDP